MGLGRKLFGAGIASRIGAGPLAVQNRELDFLRDELNQIAAQQRALAVQDLSNQGAMARQVVTGENALIRQELSNLHSLQLSGITQRGLRDRQKITIQTGIEQDTAETGAAVSSGMDRDLLLSMITEDALRIQNEENLDTQRTNFDRAFDNFHTMKSRWPGLPITFEELMSGNIKQADLTSMIDAEEHKLLEAKQLEALERLEAGRNAPG